MKKPHLTPGFLDRRDFLRNGLCSSLGLTGLLGAISSFSPLHRLLAQQPPANDDYKALVCVFLSGGNDSANMIIPTGAEHADYANYRGVAATVPEADLHPIPAIPDGRTYGLHPSFGSDDPTATTFRSLYAENKLAVAANVGTLVAPTTKQQFLDGSVPLPPQLYSHRDQVIQWNSSVSDRPFSTGWGGRVADIVDPLNNNDDLSMAISVGGYTGFQVSTQRATQPFSMSRNGTFVLTDISNGLHANGGYVNNRPGKKLQMLDEILAADKTNLHAEKYRSVFQDALSVNKLVGDTLENQTLPGDFPEFDTYAFSAQMKMIARLIASREALGMKRQTFYCIIGGFDTHANHIAGHALQLKRLQDGMATFYRATESLGVADKVTAFTSSEFSRTYTPNGDTPADGVDHAWGGHAMVLGGAVNGGLIYGRMPVQIPTGPDDTNNEPDSRGYWIPGTSVDEFCATLAKWYGLNTDQINAAFPNLHRFANPDLGFMQGA